MKYKQKIMISIAALMALMFLSQNVLSQELPKLIELGAEKCIPCKMMKPIIEELTKEYEGRLSVEFIDVWKNSQAGKSYKIRMIPTQVFLNEKGEEIYRHEGFFSKEDILKKWQELGVKL